MYFFRRNLCPYCKKPIIRLNTKRGIKYECTNKLCPGRPNEFSCPECKSTKNIKATDMAENKLKLICEQCGKQWEFPINNLFK